MTTRNLDADALRTELDRLRVDAHQLDVELVGLLARRAALQQQRIHALQSFNAAPEQRDDGSRADRLRQLLQDIPSHDLLRPALAFCHSLDMGSAPIAMAEGDGARLGALLGRYCTMAELVLCPNHASLLAMVAEGEVATGILPLADWPQWAPLLAELGQLQVVACLPFLVGEIPEDISALVISNQPAELSSNDITVLLAETEQPMADMDIAAAADAILPVFPYGAGLAGQDNYALLLASGNVVAGDPRLDKLRHMLALRQLTPLGWFARPWRE